MAVAEERRTQAGELRVHLPDMRGYSALIDAIGTDCGALSAQAETYCSNADFGKILEDLTADYAALLPVLHDLLAEQETLMKDYAIAIDQLVVDYETTDDGVAREFGGDGITGGSGTNSAKFAQVSPLDYLASPYPSESDLPEVSFGYVFDKLAWALEKFCSWDVRAQVTDWIAGDVVDVSTQAKCWEIIGERIGDTRDNLGTGQSLVFQTWSGQAANSHAASMYGWDTALEDQATEFPQLGEYLRQVAEEAVNVAQLVVDCIRLAIDLILGAWSLMYVPVVGQARFVKKAWDAYKQASKATAYLRMFWSFLRTVKDYFVVLFDKLNPAILPSAPLAV